MSAREEILGRIGDALSGADRSAVAVPRSYRSRQRPADPVSLFAERVEHYRATVTRCSEAEVPGAIAAALPTEARVVVPEGLAWPVPGGVVGNGLSPSDLDGFHAVATAASVAIAETGTIVLAHGAGQGPRALSLVPDVHVCVVRADQVVPGVPDAVSLLDPHRPQTWVSGPSATSDIELDRVEGVHGPRTLHVVLVG